MALKKLALVILEPMMKVDIEVPEDYLGDVIGDLSGRRGRIEGMEALKEQKFKKSMRLYLWLKCSDMLLIYAVKLRDAVRSVWNSPNMNQYQVQLLKLL